MTEKTKPEKELPLPLTPMPPRDPPSAPAQNGEDGREFGGPKGAEPTRYNDWERNGRCSDF